MANCKLCKVLHDEVKYLREELKYSREEQKEIRSRLIALTMLQRPENLYSSPSTDYVGGGQDQYIAYDEFGQKILVEKDINLTE